MAAHGISRGVKTELLTMITHGHQTIKYLPL